MTKQLASEPRVRSALAQIALLALMIAAGCASQSEMAELWKDPLFTSGPAENVLVVALRKDPVRRRMWEDAFARELAARGVKATSSYQLFQVAPPDTQEVSAAVRKDGYDAVLVSIRLPNETTNTYVPGAMRRESVTVQDYSGVFHSYWRDVQDPGHIETDEVSRVQTDIWATGKGGRLVFSGTLLTLESLSSPSLETAVSKSIAPVLEKEGLIPKRK